MNKLTFGLIGYGYWGPNFARIINETDQCDLKYCAEINDKNLKKVKSKYRNITVVKDYNVILADPKVDCVVIVTPTKTHYTIAKDCIIAKKNVLVEKPLSFNADEAKELVRLAKKNNVILMVGHVFLFNSSVRFIKKFINEGGLGNIQHLHFQRRNLGPIRQDVSVLWDLAPHDISMALYFIEKKPISVIASGEILLQDNIHDVVSVSLKFPDKIMVNMIFSWIDPVKIRDVAIVGDKKMILFDDVNQSEKIRIFNKNANIIKDTQDVSFGEYQIALHSGDILIPSIAHKEPLKEEFLHFIDCVKNNEQSLTDGENGLEVVEIMTAIQASLDSNSKLIKF